MSSLQSPRVAQRCPRVDRGARPARILIAHAADVCTERAPEAVQSERQDRIPGGAIALTSSAAPPSRLALRHEGDRADF